MSRVNEPDGSRISVSALLRLHVARRLGRPLGEPVPPDADLVGLARRLSGEPAGLRCEAPYPGATAGVEPIGATTRLVLGCVVHRHGAAVGVAFTTLIPGRPPTVSVAPLTAPVPGHWRPLPGGR